MNQSDKSVRLALAVFLAVAAIGGAFVGVRFWERRHLAAPVLTREQACAKAMELTKLYYAGVSTEIRQWIKAQGPEATELIFGCLDNRVDPHSKTRIAAIEAIASFGSDGLKSEVGKPWGELLVRLARTQFHAGPELERYLKEAERF